MTRIEIDFNSRDDAGYVPALTEDADAPVTLGEQVEVYDDEGNRAVATVVGVSPRLTIAPFWETFAEPDRPHLVLTRVPGFNVAFRNSLTVYLTPGVVRDESTTSASRVDTQVSDPAGVLAG